MKKGQMLIELVLALGVAMIVLVALVQVTTRSVSTSRFSKEQSEATTLATQAIEWMRQEKRAGWPEFYARNGTYCLSDLTWGTANPCGVISNTMYVRTVSMQPQAVAAGQQTTAKVTVTWEAGGKNFSADQTAVFSRF